MTTAVRSASAQAAAVSRTLKAAGFLPLPSGSSRDREGIRVSRASTGTRVSIDVDEKATRRHLGDDVMAALRETGKYEVSSLVSDEHFAILVQPAGSAS